jgi:type IV pilus assembly protein PilB
MAATDLANKLREISRAAEERDAARRAAAQGLPYIDLRKTPVSIEAVKLWSADEAKSGQLVGMQLADKDVAVAAVNPAAPETKALLDALVQKGFKLKIYIASLSGITEAWHFYEFLPEKAKDITGKVELGRAHLEDLAKRLTTLAAVGKEMEGLDLTHTSTTSLLEVVLAGSLATRASDIHFEAEEKSTRLRYRVDGVLHDVMAKMPSKNYDGLLSRVKLLSSTKINVHGEAQDGRFTILFGQKQIEVRVSIIPSEFGETIVMRVLDPDAINVSMEELGLRPDDLALVEAEIAKPNGLILNTGPTGSGKTTTLYAFLKKLASPEMKIITVEDPIEYRVQGVEQTQVNPEVGYTFAKGLRAIVRQDPDVVLVGEIRDFETADIALEAALTGHLVLSTLHTNDAVGAVPRFIDLGVKPQSIGPALSLVIAQRLVRKLCKNCKKAAALTPELKANFDKFFAGLPGRVDKKPYETPTLFEAVGCEQCAGLGYKGRVGIFEFFKGGAELEALILKEPSNLALRELAKKQDMVWMQQDGILKVIAGTTTFSEVESVTGPINWGQGG